MLINETKPTQYTPDSLSANTLHTENIMPLPNCLRAEDKQDDFMITQW